MPTQFMALGELEDQRHNHWLQFSSTKQSSLIYRTSQELEISIILAFDLAIKNITGTQEHIHINVKTFMSACEWLPEILRLSAI